MLRPERRRVDGDRALEKRLGLGVLGLLVVERAEVQAIRRDLRVLRAVDRLVNREASQVERRGLVELALVLRHTTPTHTHIPTQPSERSCRARDDDDDGV